MLQNKKFEADSSAKNILVRAVLRNEQTYSDNEETDIQMKINVILQTIDQEM